MHIFEARGFSGILDFFDGVDNMGDMVISENSDPQGQKDYRLLCDRDTYKGHSYLCPKQGYAGLPDGLNC